MFLILLLQFFLSSKKLKIEHSVGKTYKKHKNKTHKNKKIRNRIFFYEP